MEEESITFIQSCVWKQSISVLVVDDDATCLTILAALLKKFHYRVVTVKHPNDALSTLRSNSFTFDLVVADIHMPDMNGFQLQQTIAQEFDLPVVLMSADDKENTAIQCLDSGAAFFIVKPVLPDDLKDLWQFAAMKRKTSAMTVEKGKTNSNGNDDLVKRNKDEKRKEICEDNGRKLKGETSQSSSSSTTTTQKRPKVVWTSSLHNRFLEAIRTIGLERAVPKKILEVMNIPGLTRENVASHLQKYRIFLRRVTEASNNTQYTPNKQTNRRTIKPYFHSSNTHPQSTLTLDSLSRRPFPGPSDHEASSSSLVSQLLANKQNWLRPSTGNPTLFNQASFQHGTSIQGQSSIFSLEQLSSLPVSSARLHTSWTGPGSGIASTIRTLNSSIGGGGISTLEGAFYDNFVSSVPSNDHSVQNGTNYVGYSMSNIEHLPVLGQQEQICQGLVSSDISTMDYLPRDDQFLRSRSVVTNEGVDFVENRDGGELLCDMIQDYQISTMHPNEFQRVVNHHLPESFNRFDQFLSEVDIPSNLVPPMDASGYCLDNSFTDQNQPQQIAGGNIVSSYFYDGTNILNDLIPSSGQGLRQPYVEQQQQGSRGLTDFIAFDGSPSLLNKAAITPPPVFQANNNGEPKSMEFGSFSHQCLNNTLPMNPPVQLEDNDDDYFLESLLAAFREDQNCNDGF